MDRKNLKATTDTIARECLAIRVRSLNRVVTSIYDEALRPLGITINQLTMLVVLSQMGKATAKQIGSFLQMEPSTISRNLERMRKGGWVNAAPGSDARSVELTLSLPGARLIQKALPSWRKAQARARAMLGNMNTKALFQLSGIAK
jgi:DNA-binding MarR family transcriptional regulator